MPTDVPLVGLEGVFELVPMSVVMPVSEYAVAVIELPDVITLMAAGSDGSDVSGLIVETVPATDEMIRSARVVVVTGESEQRYTVVVFGEAEQRYSVIVACEDEQRYSWYDVEG